MSFNTILAKGVLVAAVVAGVNASANAGAPARRSLPSSITCSDDPRRAVEPNPLEALIRAIEEGQCNVEQSVDCAGKPASEAFQDATTCGSDGTNIAFHKHLVAGKNFEAKYIDKSSPPSTEPTATPAPPPQPNSPPPIVAPCNEGGASLVVTSLKLDEFITKEKKCTLENPTCFSDNGVTLNATQVARDTLSCNKNDALLTYLRDQGIEAKIIKDSPASTPAPSGQPASSPAPSGQPASSPAPSGQPASSPAPSTEIAPLSRDEIAEALGLDKFHLQVAAAEENLKGCDLVDAIQFLTSAQMERNMDPWSAAFSRPRNLVEIIKAIDCSNIQRRESKKKGGYTSIERVTRKVNEGSIIGMGTIMGGTCAVAILAKLGSFLYNRGVSSYTVTGHRHNARATLGTPETSQV